MEHEARDADATAAQPAVAADARPVPPWEAEQARLALEELKAATAPRPAAAETDEQRRQRQAELVAGIDARTAQLEREVELLGRLRHPGSLAGQNTQQTGFSLLGYLRRPEWLLLWFGLFCLLMWLITTGLHNWVQSMQAMNAALGK